MAPWPISQASQNDIDPVLITKNTFKKLLAIQHRGEDMTSKNTDKAHNIRKKPDSGDQLRTSDIEPLLIIIQKLTLQSSQIIDTYKLGGVVV